MGLITPRGFSQRLCLSLNIQDVIDDLKGESNGLPVLDEGVDEGRGGLLRIASPPPPRGAPRLPSPPTKKMKRFPLFFCVKKAGRVGGGGGGGGGALLKART